MKLKLLQLPKIKLSLKQRLISIALISATVIVCSTGSFLYFNSLSHSSKANSPTTIALFTATLNNTGTQVQIYWVTTSENNCDYFTIQRSMNGVDYNQLTEVQASGTSASQLSYSCIDNNPVSGISYYRLKYFDINGEYHYGAIQEINNEFVQPETEINVYPTPANNFAYIDLNVSYMASAEIFVVDLTGKTVKNINTELIEGKNKIKLDICDLPNGIYFVNLQDQSGKKISQKMIKTQ